jgi:MAF protein
MTSQLTLASASPRRQAMSRCWGVDLNIQPADIIEIPQSAEKPMDFAKRMACEKALKSRQTSVQKQKLSPHHYWLAGDTIVVLNDRILGKPKDKLDAKNMLNSLSGTTHKVMSAWALCDQQKILRVGGDCTAITFKQLSDEEINTYLLYEEYADKAGSYGIQGKAGRFVAKIEGSFNNVIGMPLAPITEDLITLQIITPIYPHLLRQSIQLQERMKVAAWRSGRDLNSVTLLAVSKRNDITMIQAAIQHKILHFGESYVNEWKVKNGQLQESNLKEDTAGDTAINIKQDQIQKAMYWHFIGKIQTNKAKILGKTIDWVHGLSRWSEAQALSQACNKAIQQGLRTQPIKALIQVNIAEEDSKNGIIPSQVSALIEQCKDLSGIQIEGLMTFPPLGTPEESRPYFKALRILRDRLKTDDLPLQHLSMGTSHDFEVAIEEGATWVRLGQALFQSSGMLNH